MIWFKKIFTPQYTEHQMSVIYREFQKDGFAVISYLKGANNHEALKKANVPTRGNRGLIRKLQQLR